MFSDSCFQGTIYHGREGIVMRVTRGWWQELEAAVFISVGYRSERRREGEERKKGGREEGKGKGM